MTSNKELGRYPWQSPAGKPADTGQCEYPTPPVPLLRPVREQAGYPDGPEPGTADYERAERNSYGASAVMLDEYEGE